MPEPRFDAGIYLQQADRFKIACIDSLSASSNTDIYLYYGYASSSDHQNAMATWNSDYKGVWHLKENGAPYSDSTSNGNNSDAGI